MCNYTSFTTKGAGFHPLSWVSSCGHDVGRQPVVAKKTIWTKSRCHNLAGYTHCSNSLAMLIKWLKNLQDSLLSFGQFDYEWQRGSLGGRYLTPCRFSLRCKTGI